MTGKQAYQNDEKWGSAEARAHRQPLPGKVVLLVGNDTAVLHLLIGQLAQKGADIALLCWHIPLETSHKIKESVQSFGRKLLLIEQGEGHDASPAHLIQTVVTELGQLDLFIDLSAQKSELPLYDDGNSQALASIQPHWQFTTAILNEMVRS
ncbi:MAG: hypothetical protein KJ069_20495 [Anaerolineae bacterium]|nr:hypothetical protein [Anaerolineae bacterium]